jgi:hypothetical protein
VFCGEFLFPVGVIFDLTLVTEPKCITNMHEDLNIVVPY